MFYKTFSKHINYYIYNLYNNMGYIYDTDSAKRRGAKRSYVGLYGLHLYIDYIENNILQTFLKHINYYIHNLYNNMRYIYDTDSAKRRVAKRSYVGLYGLHLYIDYIENNILQTFLKHINYYIHNLYNNMRYRFHEAKRP